MALLERSFNLPDRESSPRETYRPPGLRHSQRVPANALLSGETSALKANDSEGGAFLLPKGKLTSINRDTKISDLESQGRTRRGGEDP